MQHIKIGLPICF